MSNYFEFEKGRQMDVEAYRQLLLLQYRDDNDDGRMKSTKVTELHHYKQMSKSSQHEYVVARIMAPNGSTAYISFERLSGERGDPQSAKAHNPHSQQPSPSPSPSSDKVQAHTYENSHGQQPTPSPSSSSDKAPVGTATNSRQPLSLIPPSSSSTSLDSLKSHSAQDIVRALGKPKQEHDDVFVGKLRFKDDCPLYLYNLATLAVTLHKSELSYELLSNNCYWFAGVLIKVLESCFQIKFEHAKPPQPKPGGWKTITICKPSKEEVEKVIDEFNKSVKSFEEKVKEKHTPKEEGPPGHKFKEDARKFEAEARRLTEEARLKSMEDERKFSKLKGEVEMERKWKEAALRENEELRHRLGE